MNRLIIHIFHIHVCRQTVENMGQVNALKAMELGLEYALEATTVARL